jgi:hypothetical protein
MTRRFRYFLIAALAGAAALLPGTGQAHRPWGPTYGYGSAYGAPRYWRPPPAYYRPYGPAPYWRAPVVVAPPPVYYPPRPYAAPGVSVWVR